MVRLSKLLFCVDCVTRSLEYSLFWPSANSNLNSEPTLPSPLIAQNILDSHQKITHRGVPVNPNKPHQGKIRHLRIKRDHRPSQQTVGWAQNWLASCNPSSRFQVTVTLTSQTVKKYDASLVVDVEGVGDEVLALPLSARYRISDYLKSRTTAVPSRYKWPNFSVTLGPNFFKLGSVPTHLCDILGNQNFLEKY